jgi:hypothetical protein
MLIFFQLLPTILTSLVLAAHFLRMDFLLVVFCFLALPFLLFIKHIYSARVVKFFLVFGLFEWLRTIYVLYLQRSANGEPYLRMLIILFAVILFNFLAIFCSEPKLLKKDISTKAYFRLQPF